MDAEPRIEGDGDGITLVGLERSRRRHAEMVGVRERKRYPNCSPMHRAPGKRMDLAPRAPIHTSRGWHASPARGPCPCSCSLRRPG
jgi:hypothetical protein